MGKQRWKVESNLYGCNTKYNNGQINKDLDYENVYIKEFLDCDPLKDWDSIKRCINLWEFFSEKINLNGNKYTVLDCGTKDGQFTAYLNDLGYNCLGIEISKNYVKYAKLLNRNVEYGDVCNLKLKDNSYDIVYSHHVLGLVKDYKLALKEMLRVSSKYVVTLNDIPGNKRKHYSYIENIKVIKNWLKEDFFDKNEIIYFDKNPLMPNTKEKILIIKKI